MPLSWNEIRNNALAFAKEWADETSEDAEAKSFWDGFFEVFGIRRRRVASFEKPVHKGDGTGGFIDLLWKGVLLVEHKSRGKDLDRAAKQAFDYFPGLKERDLPRYVLVSDFARFRLYDLDEGTQTDFPLAQLNKHVRLFGFIAGYQSRSFGKEDSVNIRAAEKLGRLHDLLKASGYDGHQLEVLLVRLLFCVFAEDTGIFERRQFADWIEQRTGEDGADLGPLLTDRALLGHRVVLAFAAQVVDLFGRVLHGEPRRPQHRLGLGRGLAAHVRHRRLTGVGRSSARRRPARA